LETEDIVFDYIKKNIASKKNASITDKTKNATYQINNFSLSIDNEVLKGEDILVKTNASKKYNDKYFVKKGIFDLKNQTFVTQDIEINLKKDLFGNDENDPRIKGVSSSKKDGITTVNKGIFTSCKKNKDCVPWSIQAEKVEYNENKKQIYYDNALLKIYNTPIIYFPKFFHPGPSVKRQSGFLAPKITNSQTLGTAFQIPYYTVLSDNKDFTFTPTLFSENIFKFQNEYRQENKNSSFVGDFSFTNGYKSNTEKQRNSITHFFGKYSSNLELDNFVNSSLDITLQKVNNDTYLKVFDQNIVNSEATPESKDTLISKIELDLNHENYDLTAGFISYEDLQKDKSDRYEFALPYYVFSKGLWSEDNVGSLNFTSFGDNVLKDTNNLKSRMINDFDFASFNFINQSGFKNNLNFFVKNLITSAKNDPQYDSKISNELMGIIELQSSFPMMKTDDSFIKYLDPKISIRVNPSNMINYSAEDRRINNDNIFDINRLGLRDTLESGKSLTIGLDYKKESLNNINK
jgi:LPS-assembly protein